MSVTGSFNETVGAGWTIWLVTWAAVAASQLAGHFWRGQTSIGIQLKSSNPELEAMVAQVGRLEREAQTLCRPDSFVAYAKLERELDEKRRRIDELRQQQQQARHHQSVAAGWKNRLKRSLLTLTSLCWLIVAGVLWLLYRNHVVFYFPCEGQAWRWFRFLRLDPVSPQTANRSGSCALHGGPWLWLCVFVGRHLFQRIPHRLSRKVAGR
jgi:hypothetical protein